MPVALDPPEWLSLVLWAAIIGYLGANRWVSFAFVPPRLAFVFPHHLLLMLHGRKNYAGLGNLVCAGILCVSLGAMFSYFRVDDFLNKAYVLPFEEVAAYVTAHSGASDTSVILDESGTNEMHRRNGARAACLIGPRSGTSLSALRSASTPSPGSRRGRSDPTR